MLRKWSVRLIKDNKVIALWFEQGSRNEALASAKKYDLAGLGGALKLTDLGEFK